MENLHRRPVENHCGTTVGQPPSALVGLANELLYYVCEYPPCGRGIAVAARFRAKCGTKVVPTLLIGKTFDCRIQEERR